MKVSEAKLAVQVLDSVRRVIKEQDKMIVEQRIQLERRDKELIEQGKAAARKTATAVASLRAELTDEQKVKLDNIVERYEHQLTLKDQQIEGYKASAALMQTQIAKRDSVLMRQNDQIRKLTKDYEQELKRSKKTVVGRIAQVAPWLIAAGAIATN